MRDSRSEVIEWSSLDVRACRGDNDGLIHRVLLKNKTHALKGKVAKVRVYSLACGLRNYSEMHPPAFVDEVVTCLACLHPEAKGA